MPETQQPAPQPQVQQQIYNQPDLNSKPQPKKRHNWIMTIIISLLVLSLSAVVLWFFVASPWSPILSLFNKSEYVASSVEQLKESVPSHVKDGLNPSVKEWEELKVAENFEGSRSVDYRFSPVGGSVSSKILAKIYLKEKISQEEFGKRAESAILESGYESEGFFSPRVNFCSKNGKMMNFFAENNYPTDDITLYFFSNPCRI